MSTLFRIYIKEMRCLFRDWHILLYSVALPAVLYPVLFISAFQVITYIRGIEEMSTSRVELGGNASHSVRGFESRPHSSAKEDGAEIEFLSDLHGVIDSKDVRSRLVSTDSQKSADAALIVNANGQIARLGISTIEADLYYSSAIGPSRQARARLEKELVALKMNILEEAAGLLGEPSSILEPIALERNSLASDAEVASHVLGLVLPLLMTLMIALGGFYPALDATVGEKERGTLESSLLLPLPRYKLVMGKYFAVTTTALVSFVLNFLSMLLTLLHLQAHLPTAGFQLSLSAILVILLGAFLLAAFLSSLMMLLAFLARTFKEGQAYVTPIYLISMTPVLLLAHPEIELEPALAAVPLINITLLFRHALEGRLEFLSTSIVLASSALYSVLALWCAARLLAREEVATGGSIPLMHVLRKKLTKWLPRERSSANELEAG